MKHIYSPPIFILASLSLFVLFTAFSFSINTLDEKHDFVYKTVKGHEIKTNIFLSASPVIHPLVVHFRGGGFIFGNRDQGIETTLKGKLPAHVNQNYPPTLIVQTKNDRLVDLEQHTVFYEFLKEMKVKSEIYLVDNDHSTELINQNSDVVDKITRFLNEQFNP